MKAKRGSAEGRRRQAEAARRTHTTHGMRGSREYESWHAMKSRCLRSKDPFFERYGGRGIKVHPAWIASFEAFYRDVGPRPPGTVLDRIDNDGDYEPSNVRWVTQKANQRNRSSNTRLTFCGETRTIIEWAERLGFRPGILNNRLLAGWSVEKTLTTPVAPRHR